MTVQGDPQPQIWRQLVLRGIPLHLVVPAVVALLSFALLASGGVASWLGGWLMTVGLPLAVGAFVADPRALAAPAVAWVTWLVLSRTVGDLPQTPIGVATVLAVLGAAAVLLAQRAVLPAVEGAELASARDPDALPDIDELLADPPVAPELGVVAEVDEALSELLDEPIDEAGELALVDGEAETTVDAPTTDEDTPDTAEQATGAYESQSQDEGEGGHVIEFQALTEADLAEAADAEATAEAEANRAEHR